ncbi:MAG TPA: B12-binding domain-containing radical SAM protein [Actinobacteria bacterium]|nr:B12-binding domain-containing radical SAM protein [Actinomycetota bacterium]
MAKVGLVFPCTNPSSREAEISKWGYKGVPIGLLSMASYLESVGHQVRVIDTMMYPKDRVEESTIELAAWADCVGFSVMTTQVSHALSLSELIKKAVPGITVIWGGIHSTLFPEQTETDPAVDFVVYGEGEEPMRDLIKYLRGEKIKLRDIPNLVYREGATVVKTEPLNRVDVKRLPGLNYHLLDIEKYIDREVLGQKVRGLDVLTSRGCPYRCSFCANTILLGQKWRPRDIDTVLGEIDNLVETHDLNFLWIMDDYFFGDRKRPQALADHILRKGYQLSWEANIRANDLSSNRLSDEYLRTMRRSGLIGLKIGAESGSDEILKLLKKDINSDQVVRAVKRCVSHDIVPYLYFMNGIPGEDIGEIKKTSLFMYNLKTAHPQVVLNGPGIFRPYPGGELYYRCLDAGYSDPETLREWAERDLGANYLPTGSLPWVPEPKFVDDLHWYLYKACREDRILKYRFAWPRMALGRMAQWRFQHNFWRFRFESRIVGMARYLRNIWQGAR